MEIQILWGFGYLWCKGVPFKMHFGRHIFYETLRVEGLKNALLACFCLKQVPCNLEV